jgi:hypothetical protein
MIPITEFKSSNDTSFRLGYDFASTFQELVDNQTADCFILATEYGFSPLGLASDVIVGELGLDVGELMQVADWNRNENPEVSLIGIKQRVTKQDSFLKGAVLAASQTSKSYQQFVTDSTYKKPSRDFFYNVTYEAIYYAAHTLKAKKLSISHLSASGNFHEDIATCTAEALLHFNAAFPGFLNSVLFVGCCISPNHFKGIAKLEVQENPSQHRAIKVSTSMKNGFDLLTLQTCLNSHDNYSTRRVFALA